MATVASVLASVLSTVYMDWYFGWFRLVAKLDLVTVLIAASIATLCICNICDTAIVYGGHVASVVARSVPNICVVASFPHPPAVCCIFVIFGVSMRTQRSR